MAWQIEYTDEFGVWFQALGEDAQDRVAKSVELLSEHGPRLGYPHSSDVRSSRHGEMRELRIQHRGEPIRVFYAFDARRVAILILGANKVGQDRFYVELVPVVDRIYDEYLREIGEER